MMGRAVQQDFEYRIEPFFFTAPITQARLPRRTLHRRRRRAASSSCPASRSAAPLGLLLPGHRSRPRRADARFARTCGRTCRCCCRTCHRAGRPLLLLAALTRRMLPVYIGSVLLLVGYLAAHGAAARHGQQDACGADRPVRRRRPIRQLTEYWSISERNTRLVPLDGLLLWNRAALARARRCRASALALPLRASRTPAASRKRAAAGHRAQAGARTDRALDHSRAAVHAAAARRSWRVLPRMVLAQLPRDGQERLFRRHRARRRAVLLTREHDRGQHLRHGHLARDLPDARARLRHVRRVHARDHHVLCGRARLARARSARSTRSTTRCRCRRGCRSWRSCSR